MPKTYYPSFPSSIDGSTPPTCHLISDRPDLGDGSRSARVERIVFAVNLYTNFCGEPLGRSASHGVFNSSTNC
jgi:hypothetical protein